MCARFFLGPLLFLTFNHQYTDPPSALGFWIALEECTAKNGALSFLPGSHLTTPITKRFVRLGEGKGTGMESLDVPSLDSKQLSNIGKGEYILEPCKPGNQFFDNLGDLLTS